MKAVIFSGIYISTSVSTAPDTMHGIEKEVNPAHIPRFATHRYMIPNIFIFLYHLLSFSLYVLIALHDHCLFSPSNKRVLGIVLTSEFLYLMLNELANAFRCQEKRMSFKRFRIKSLELC